MPTQRWSLKRAWEDVLAPTLDTLTAAPFRGAHTLLHHNTVTRAARNPAYRALSTSLHNARAERPRALSWEEFRAELHQVEQKETLEQDASLNWAVEMFLTRAAHSRPISSSTRHIQWGWQRLTRGWDDRATWSLDVHLTHTLGQQLIHLADTTHGWPDTITETFEEWTDLLRAHGRTLTNYSARAYDLNGDEGETVIQDAQESLHWVTQHLPHLWD